MGKPKTLSLLIILVLLGLSNLLSLDAVRLSRNLLVTMSDDPSGFEAETQVIGEKTLEEDLIHGRIDIEDIGRNDYPGSGANNRHDPPNKQG